MIDARDSDRAEPITPASPIGQLGQAMTWLNQRALRFTRPGSHWLLTSVKLGFIIKVTAILVALLQSFAEGTLNQEIPAPDRNIRYFVIVGIVLAPLLETLQIILVHWLTRRWLGLAGFVAASTVLAYAMHGPPLAYYPTGAAAAFLIMSYQYVSFREVLGTGKAFAGGDDLPRGEQRHHDAHHSGPPGLARERDQP